MPRKMGRPAKRLFTPSQENEIKNLVLKLRTRTQRLTEAEYSNLLEKVNKFNVDITMPQLKKWIFSCKSIMKKTAFTKRERKIIRTET